MIQNLHITNFQSHKDTELKFHPGVNVIVGASDSGKTSILRALRWLIWNRPNGDDFRSDWGGETIVEISVDGFIITRSKDKENLYKVFEEHPDGVDETLKAFGTKVPAEIQKLLNIDDTNLQSQFDSPFLISSSPGEVAGYFNQIAHLERIDSSMSYVNNHIMTLTAKHKADKVTLDESQEELKQYDYLSKFEIDLEELEHQQSELSISIAALWGLTKHLNWIATNTKEIKKQEKITVLEAPVNKILRLYTDKKEQEKESMFLFNQLVSVKKYKEEEEALRKKGELLPQVKYLLKLHRERTEMIQARREYRLAERELTLILKSQFEYDVLIEEKEAKFHEHMPDECPLCGNKTT